MIVEVCHWYLVHLAIATGSTGTSLQTSESEQCSTEPLLVTKAIFQIFKEYLKQCWARKWKAKKTTNFKSSPTLDFLNVRNIPRNNNKKNSSLHPCAPTPFGDSVQFLLFWTAVLSNLSCSANFSPTRTNLEGKKIQEKINLLGKIKWENCGDSTGSACGELSRPVLH